MKLISKFSKKTCFLLCVIDIFSKYAWIVPLEGKKGTNPLLMLITDAFQKILESNRRPSRIWVDKESEFYNRSMKLWLRDSDIERYSTYNQAKSVAAERLIRSLKNKIYRYMDSMSKNVYIENLADIVNKYNNLHHSTIIMTSVDVKSSIYTYKY